MNDIELHGRLAAIELVLSTVLAAGTRDDRKALDRMHQVLSDRLRDSAAGVASQHEDVPELDRMRFVESACDALDSLMARARAFR